MATAPPLPARITVRFTAALPDLAISVPRPAATTVVAFTRLIRARLAPPAASRRLRLIHGGKILPDAAVLSSVLRVPPPPPRPDDVDVAGKGKARAVDTASSLPPVAVVVHCSVGDPLRADELAAEAAAAAEGPAASAVSARPAASRPAASTTPAPRGFDRLLGAGLSSAEVSQLRLQFRAVQAAAHTPDSMPSPSTLRRMEDAWLDDNTAAAAAAGSAPSPADADAQAGALDDLLWGLVIGFLWPLGSMAWLGREDGVWSSRRQTAVWSGFILCLSFGVMNLLA